MPDRPALWLSAIGVGLCLVSGVGLLLLAAGLALPWWAYLAWFGLGLGGTVAASFVLDSVKDWRVAKADLYGQWQRHEAQEIENRRRAAELEAAQRGAEPAESAHRATAVAVWRFMRAGDALGFAWDGLNEAGVLKFDAWMRVKDFYLLYPADSPVLTDRGGSAGTVWSPTWTLGRVGDLLAMDELPLPPGAPPVVSGEFAVKQNANGQKKRKAGAVVEGVARQAGSD
jgi:hypothetical protein